MEKKEKATRQTATLQTVISEVDSLVSTLRSGVDYALSDPKKTLRRLDELIRGQLPQLSMIQGDLEMLSKFNAPIAVLDIDLSYIENTEVSRETDEVYTCPTCGGTLDNVVDKNNDPYAYTCRKCGAFWDYEDIHPEDTRVY